MRRRALLLGVGALAGGCLGSPGPNSDPTPTDTGSTPTATETTPTHSPPLTHGGAEPDPDLPVVVENDDETAHTVAVTVHRGSESVVHDEDHEIPAGTDRTVYNLKRADPDGIEAFSIEMALDGDGQRVQVETDACHGSAYGSISERGELHLTYSIC